MKYGIRFLAFALVLLLSLPALLTSCTPKKTLKVVSRDYPRLTELIPGEVDRERYFSLDADNPYLYFNCSVSVKNGELQISNKEYGNLSSYLGNNGFFVALHIHDDSWVRFFPYDSGKPNVKGEPAVVFEDGSDGEEYFHGFAEVDRENAYVVTNFLDTTGEVEDWKWFVRIWRLHCDREQYLNGHCGWSWEVIATIPEASVSGQSFSESEAYAFAQCYSEEENALFLMTTVGVYRYSIGDGRLTKIGESKLFGEDLFSFPSAVYLNGEMICGNSCGLYTYHLTTGEEWWFPMDYDKIVG